MPDTVRIVVNNQEIEHFQEFSMIKSLDHVGDPFSFNVPFFPETSIYRELFKPFGYQNVEIYIGNEKQLTGRIERPNPRLSNETSINVQGRSKPGSIVDCSFAYQDKVQWTKAKLDQITNDVLANFDFSAVFQDDPGALFEEAGPSSPTEIRFSFLHNLARQRKLLMGQTVDGDLLFRKASTNVAPVAELAEGQQGVTVSSGIYDGTKVFSTYDMFGQDPAANDKYARQTDSNIPIYRPMSAKSNDTNSANIVESVEWLASSAIAEAIQIPLSVEGWRTPDGDLWAEDTYITLTAPSNMIYKPFKFLIANVEFVQAPDITNLSLTIPGAYSGIMPEAYPW